MLHKKQLYKKDCNLQLLSIWTIYLCYTMWICLVFEMLLKISLLFGVSAVRCVVTVQLRVYGVGLANFLRARVQIFL